MSQRRSIAILPPEVAERIAAGEVVERPASVVRELLDNAIDAGATEVTVALRGGGLELIQVSDNGLGIRPDEVELAFQHHATSKIETLDDLLTLRTLGFRGEALPSIAAVAEVTLLTRDESCASGTLIILRAGEVICRRRGARQPGTTVTVRHLFANVPARLKFLSAGRRESILVGQVIRHYALARPSLRISFVLDGRLSFRSSGRGRLDAALADVYGPAVATSLHSLPATHAAGAVASGFISSRTVTRPSHHHLMLIVNGRWAACRGLLATIEAAYRPLLPRGRHPIGVLALEVPPGELDPNVHPAKAEVRLAHEREIAASVAETIRATLGHAPAYPDEDANFALASDQYRLPLPHRRVAESRGPSWYRPPETGESPADAGASRDSLAATLSAARILGQVRQSLILAEGEHGLLLIDQHRAHERIIHERLLRREGGAGVEAQALLEPVVLELKPRQATILEARLAHLEGLGLSCQRIGGRDYLVRAIPSIPGHPDLVPYLSALLEEAASDEENWRERLVVSLACRAALRRNRPLSDAELRALVRDLASTSAPAVCPHGSPLILWLGSKFLDKQFGW